MIARPNPNIRVTAACLAGAFLLVGASVAPAAPDEPPRQLDSAAMQYLGLIENFAGFAEEHWNEKEQSFDAAGSGVTWARGNGGACIVHAVLLTEFPDRATFSAKKVPRKVMLDHVQKALRSLCLHSNSCTDPRAIQPGTWGGADGSKGGHWQAGLETEHWTVAARLLASQLDDDTKALVRQVSTAEADLAIKDIPSAKQGDTAADDCSWDAGILGVCAAIYADDPRAAKWDEWAKRWALNIEARVPDRQSQRMIDGKPLSEWLVSINVNPDLTLENHGFWDIPYQVSFAALSEPIIAYRLCGKDIPEAFHANAREEGDTILKWLILPDGDLLCPQGLDWAERDVQHSWAYTELGTLLDEPWARAAEARCLKLLTTRQAVFGDGSIHALDFGYETDLATVWTYSFLLHKFFPRPESAPTFDEPRGSKVYPDVAVAVQRTPDLVSSVTWFRARQAIMISPNNAEALGDHPSFTRYDPASGTGWIKLQGDKKNRPFRVEAPARIIQDHGCLSVSFSRIVPGLARQQIAYCALPEGPVVVFSHWEALKTLEVAELIDHPFRWIEIDRMQPKRTPTQTSPGTWSIDGKLQMQILGGTGGEALDGGINGAPKRNFHADSGEVLQDTVCIYQPLTSTHPPLAATGTPETIKIGPLTLHRDKDGHLTIEK